MGNDDDRRVVTASEDDENVLYDVGVAVPVVLASIVFCILVRAFHTYPDDDIPVLNEEEGLPPPLVKDLL